MISLEAINQQVNQQVIPRPAKDWTVNFSFGDCKTYSVDKLVRAVQAGYDPRDFAVWIVLDETKKFHAILVFKGVKALDNRFNWLEPVDDLKEYGYKLVVIIPATEK